MLSKLQKDHAVWQRRNFPHAEKWECLVGIQEEIGELAHSFLKKHQGIRNDENHDSNMEDAVGDIVIYLMGFCTLNDIDIDQCIEGAWGIVKDRDWRNDATSDDHAKYAGQRTCSECGRRDRICEFVGNLCIGCHDSKHLDDFQRVE